MECRNSSFLGCLVQVSTLKRSLNKILNRTPLQECNEKKYWKLYWRFGSIFIQCWRFLTINWKRRERSRYLNFNRQRNNTDHRNSEKQCQDEEGDKTEEPRGPTSIEAFNALEVAMEWVQRQDSVDRIQLLHLKRLRDVAVEKEYPDWSRSL